MLELAIHTLAPDAADDETLLDVADEPMCPVHRSTDSVTLPYEYTLEAAHPQPGA